jgi:transaldolase
MNATQTLHILAHGLCLDNTTRLLLVGVTLTSNPTIFDHAIKSSTRYDDPIRHGLRQAKPDEDFGSSSNTLTGIVAGVILDAAS